MDQDKFPTDDPRERQEFLLSQYLDGQVDDDERADVEQQLRDDPRLRARLDELRRVDEFVREWGERAPATDPAAFVARIRHRCEAAAPRRPVTLLFRLAVPMAAAAAIVFAISLFWREPSTPGGPGSPTAPIAVVEVGPGPAVEPAGNDRPSPVIRVSFSRSPVLASAGPDSTTRSLLVAAAGSFTTDSVAGVVDEDLPVF